MDRSYSEKQVLRKLDIPDFRHLTKDKVIALANMLPHMDPEVAKKALDQFPDFASASLNIMQEYKSVLEQSLTADSETYHDCYDMYNRVMNSLEEMLSDGELTVEERLNIIRQMKDVADALDAKDTEKAANRLRLMSLAGGVALGIVAILASTLGLNIKLDRIEDGLKRLE